MNSDRERAILYDIPYMQDLGEGGMIWETSTETCILSYVK